MDQNGRNADALRGNGDAVKRIRENIRSEPLPAIIAAYRKAAE